MLSTERQWSYNQVTISKELGSPDLYRVNTDRISPRLFQRLKKKSIFQVKAIVYFLCVRLLITVSR